MVSLVTARNSSATFFDGFWLVKNLIVKEFLPFLVIRSIALLTEKKIDMQKLTSYVTKSPDGLLTHVMMRWIEQFDEWGNSTSLHHNFGLITSSWGNISQCPSCFKLQIRSEKKRKSLIRLSVINLTTKRSNKYSKQHKTINWIVQNLKISSDSLKFLSWNHQGMENHIQYICTPII